MQEFRSSNPPVITGICDPNKSRAQHHRKGLKVLLFSKKDSILFSIVRMVDNSRMFHLT